MQVMLPLNIKIKVVIMERSQGDFKLEHLTQGSTILGLSPLGEAEVLSASWVGSNAITVVFRDQSGQVNERLIMRTQEPQLALLDSSKLRDFDADANDWKLGAEAVRISNASSYDPMVALTTSDLDPLPHQLRAVYQELLPRTPLRFLLADDPGAGKTIMAGLYLKELMLRSDAERVMIVVPGGLADQWQTELSEKFGLSFEILTRDAINGAQSGNIFGEKRLLIAKMDMLARDPELVEKIRANYWDAVIIDEAHRMSAHFYGDEITRTRRYELGLALGEVARHFLLMTATPHSGNPDTFQLFLALLDGDRFEGRIREGARQNSLDGMMRRMVKEDLLTMDGKALFPERRAYSLEYDLSEAEQELYEVVTEYVREQMVMAQGLDDTGEGRRRNNIGFALTVLQRRLASSPEAILRSLERRQAKLVRSLANLTAEGISDVSVIERLRRILGEIEESEIAEIEESDLDELNADEREAIEEKAASGASAARTIEELKFEIEVVDKLITVARKVRNSGSDRKWSELKQLLTGDELIRDEDGLIRKIIIFTEHKDTLDYLERQIATIVPDVSQIERIDGSTRREDRRKVQERFMNDPNSRILIATDAAGEGLNLQRAHLMVNYDLPWNPNRIEQRFGRIHRIGQTEVCHLWNLVAVNTREGQVFQRLLQKLEEMRQAYKGKVFDVLGEAFANYSLRDLLIEAIQYGDDPERIEDRNRVIDAAVGDGIKDLLEERSLHAEVIDLSSVDAIRRAFEEAQARKLQPHYIKEFFIEAFSRLGGRIEEREDGRFEIIHVPQLIIDRDRLIGNGAPVVDRYECITFDRNDINKPSGIRAQLMAPGHPLMTSITDVLVQRARSLLKHGTILVDENDLSLEPRLLVGIKSEIQNGVMLASGKQQIVDRNFEFVEIDKNGTARFGGPAPYLDYSALEKSDTDFSSILNDSWLSEGAENLARDWAVTERLPLRSAAVAEKIHQVVDRTRELVRERLSGEIQYWDHVHDELIENPGLVRRGRSVAAAFERARMLEARLQLRLESLAKEEMVISSTPVVTAAALVIPRGLLDQLLGISSEAVATYAKDTKEVDQRAIAKTIASEIAIGRNPEEMPHNNPGWDIRSLPTDGKTVFIEVKGRIEGADTFTITRNEVLTAKNLGDSYRLVLVKVSQAGASADEIKYISNPFAEHDVENFLVCSYNLDWHDMWARGQAAN